MKNTVINTVNGVLDSNNVEDVKMVNVKNTKYRLYISRSDINNTTRYIVPVNSVEEASKAYQQIIIENVFKKTGGMGFAVLQMYDKQLCKWIRAIDECGKAIEVEINNDEICWILWELRNAQKRTV